MADYTPTTDEMADAYTRMRVREAKGETGGERILTAIDALSEFERGLAKHDLQVLREAADALVEYGRETYWRDDSPFHADGRFWTGHHADWLRDRIERGVQ